MQLFSSEVSAKLLFPLSSDPVLTGLSSTIHELKAPGTEMGSIEIPVTLLVGQLKRW